MCISLYVHKFVYKYVHNIVYIHKFICNYVYLIVNVFLVRRLEEAETRLSYKVV